MGLFEKLRQRRVFQVAVAYVVIGWAMIEAASTLLPMFGAPEWAPRAFTIVVFLGFPLAVALAWILQVTPEGIVVDRSDVTPSLPRADRGQLRFVSAPDGTRIAYALSGDGPTVVKTAHWLTHLEQDWDSPLWRHWLGALGEGRRLLRYDERGCGLSDRNVDDLSVDAFVSDLEAVVAATACERFALFGASQGGPVSIAYAVRHPERVSCLVLYGSYARGWAKRDNSDFAIQESAMLNLVRTGWGKDNPAFRQVFASLFVPEANAEQMASFDRMARDSATPDMAARLLQSFGSIDVRPLLPQVRVPTLVIHCRNDERIPLGNGRELAAAIPGAELAVLDSRNHILLGQDPAFPEFRRVLNDFLATHGA